MFWEGFVLTSSSCHVLQLFSTFFLVQDYKNVRGVICLDNGAYKYKQFYTSSMYMHFSILQEIAKRNKSTKWVYNVDT